MGTGHDCGRDSPDVRVRRALTRGKMAVMAALTLGCLLTFLTGTPDVALRGWVLFATTAAVVALLLDRHEWPF